MAAVLILEYHLAFCGFILYLKSILKANDIEQITSSNQFLITLCKVSCLLMSQSGVKVGRTVFFSPFPSFWEAEEDSLEYIKSH